MLDLDGSTSSDLRLLDHLLVYVIDFDRRAVQADQLACITDVECIHPMGLTPFLAE
jgi:hypothetical protein